jgi:hypothetical protein
MALRPIAQHVGISCPREALYSCLEAILRDQHAHVHLLADYEIGRPSPWRVLLQRTEMIICVRAYECSVSNGYR